MNIQHIKTIAQLKESGYRPKSVKEELRANLIQKLKQKQPLFEGIVGYEETVIPDLQRAILSRHNLILLGLRGQAKTRIARMMTDLLDEYIPIVKGSELNDDPLQPLSKFAKDLIAEMGDETPIDWVHRSERYAEKLATPDVSVADLIGDVDPIKAATLKLPYSDERVIHYGIIPRSHRGIFVINELPDLQARIQVALFNILQEGDIQIRGFKLRLPLDIQFVFTANPEDYTHRGSIVTPLKDRIESQILTHYPKSIQESLQITAQESKISAAQQAAITVSPLCALMIEEIAQEARSSEYVDSKSGVSARLTISAYQNLYSAAERRMLINGETHTYMRITDLVGIIPAITGKIELVYEGEKEGAASVAQHLISKALRRVFMHYFPNPEKMKRSKQENPYKAITDWFGKGKNIDLLFDMSDKDYEKALTNIPQLQNIVKQYQPEIKDKERLLMMEFVLHGLAEHSLISKQGLTSGNKFLDILSGMFSSQNEEDEDDWGGYYEDKK